MCKYLIFFTFLLASSVESIPSMGEFLCDTTSCLMPCPKVDECKTGKLMYDPGRPCSCCKYCLDFIGKDETCNINSSDQECGPGLTCSLLYNKEYKCQTKETDCIKAQNEYDADRLNGKIGTYVPRPNCDVNGNFVSSKCQPDSSCYCVDKGNNRIYGEAPPAKASEMNCECSRDYMEALKLDSQLLQFPHCLPNGNYDQLQCTGFACYCIDTQKMTKTSGLVVFSNVQELPCYNREVHYSSYQRPCEMEKSRIESLRKQCAQQGITVDLIVGLELPDCSPDGYFLPVRKTATSTYCVDHRGEKIEHFEIRDASSTSNCACARTRHLLQGQGVPLPKCCPDGSYRGFQCRGGICFCVDTKTGDIIKDVLEVPPSEVDNLACYREALNSCH